MHSRSLAAAIAVALATVILPLPGTDAIASGATCRGLSVTIVGTNGADNLVGTPGPDVIDGGNGNDTIVGLGGNDTICGGNGNDVLSGGDGDDTVDGGNGNDTISGDDGADELYGLNGSDTIHGGKGDDQIEGYNGNDTLDGGGGADVVDGGNGNDSCDDAETAPNCESITYDGEPGEPPSEPVVCNGLTATLVGTDGDDTLTGTNGSDVIVALGGNDTINGGNGNDVICAGLGDDIVNGGNGDDFIDGGDGADEISGHNGHDTLNGGGGPDTIDGGNGNDDITGGSGIDTIDGGNGNDTIEGGAGDDVIQGWNGRDTIHGGNGNDHISGHNGNDTLDGGNGVDEAFGGNGNDSCDDFESASSCETESSDGEPGGIEVVEEITIPDNPAPLVFDVNTGGFEGVDLEVTTSGGLYPWDIVVEDAITTTTMAPVVVSELINIEMNPDASGFASAVLTLAYDETLIAETDETDLGIWTFDEFAQLWVPAGTTQSVDVDANTVTATLEHFSIYAVLDMDITDPESWERVLGEPVVQCVASEPSGNFDLALMLDNDALGTHGLVPGLLESLEDTIDSVNEDRRISVSRFDYLDAETTFANRLALPAQKALAKTHVANLRVENADEPNDIILALDALRYSVWETDAVRPFPRRVAIIVAVSDPTIRGYTPSSLRLRILRLLVAGVQVYVVGDGPASENPLLQHIATEAHQGLYFDIADTTGLVAAVNQASNNVDDGTDSDLDTITDCVETNGAFTPAIFTGAAPTGDDRIVTGHESAYFVLNPANADTDNDGVDDNVELVEADLRDDPLVAQTYAYLIDAGVTRYYRLISDPTDPLRTGSFDTDTDRFSDGLLHIDGLDVEQETLFQPIRYGGMPAIETRLIPQRTGDGYQVTTLGYTGAPITYNDDEDCIDNCVAVEALALTRKDDGRFGCSLFGDDLECAISKIVRDARSDQGIFAGDGFVSSGFLRDQVALRCAVAGNDVDRCVDGAALLFFSGIEPSEIDLIVDTFLLNDGEFLIPGELYLLEEFSNTSTIGPGDTERFLTMRTAVTNVFLNYELLDSDGDEFVALAELDGFADPVNDPTGDVAEAAQFLLTDARVLDEYGVGTGYRRGDLGVAMVRTHGFTLTGAVPRTVLSSFPLVNEGTVPFSLDAFEASNGPSGSRSDATPALRLLLERALATVATTDRVAQNDLVSRLPETSAGIRNDLFTALYIEYSEYIQRWLDPTDVGGKGNNWALVAPWASVGIRAAILGDTAFGLIPPALRQSSADGNQFIFKDVGSRFASLIQLLEATPEPTADQWQSWFNNSTNFANGDKQLRDGFLALVAARYEPDFERAQTLLLQSNLLLATHEQSGVQPHLEPFETVAPDFVEAWFGELEMGDDRRLETAIDPYDQIDELVEQVQFVDANGTEISGGDPRGAAPVGNLIWDQNLLTLDPTGRDPGELFDAAGFNVEVGGTGIGVVNVIDLGGVPSSTPPSWTLWQQSNLPAYEVTEFGVYQGVRATQWWNWEERQWFLANLFRIIHTDDLVREAPVDRDLSSGQVDDYSGVMIEVLRIVE